MSLFLAAFEQSHAVPVGGIPPNPGFTQALGGGGKFSPSGSVYHSTAVFQGFAPQLNPGNIPSPSNFGNVIFPVRVWDKNADYGDNLSIYQNGSRGAPAT